MASGVIPQVELETERQRDRETERQRDRRDRREMIMMKICGTHVFLPQHVIT
jgi:hypothetical protein